MMILTNSAFATSLEITPNNTATGKARIYTGGSAQASLELTGKAARLLYDALNVEPEGSFGLVQNHVKKTDKVECVLAILGDIPGQMAERYSCTISIDKN